MAIQFGCPGCGQRIEVDDDFAGRNVGCPYCRTTCATPMQSEPLGAAPLTPVAPPVPARDYRSANRMATIGLILALLSPVVQFVLFNIGSQVSGFAAQITPQISSPGFATMSDSEKQKIVMPIMIDSLKQYWGQHFGLAIISSLVAVGLSIAAVSLSIAALAKSTEFRVRAIIGVVLSLTCGLGCSSMFPLSNFLKDQPVPGMTTSQPADSASADFSIDVPRDNMG